MCAGASDCKDGLHPGSNYGTGMTFGDRNPDKLSGRADDRSGLLQRGGVKPTLRNYMPRSMGRWSYAVRRSDLLGHSTEIRFE
jgi:hypothetical protein